MSLGDSFGFVSMILAGVAVLYLVKDQRDRKRYVKFLIRVHKQAEEDKTGVEQFFALPDYPVYLVKIGVGELDLAFKAMAEGLLFFKEGQWQCRPALIIADRPFRGIDQAKPE